MNPPNYMLAKKKIMIITKISDVQEIVKLLQESSLPTSDLKVAQNSFFFGVFSGKSLCSCVGVEFYAGLGLLRSLAVSPTYQKKGIGSALVMHIENFSLLQSVDEIYLLTTTSRDFFKMLGYSHIGRNIVPKAIKDSTQFSSVCPDSATIMYKKLQDKNRIHR